MNQEDLANNLIDGVFAPAERRFSTLNPATEEVLGEAADGSAADMDAAIGAARRAFDETSWSDDLDLRLRCVAQLRDELLAHSAQLKDLTISEVGCPRMLADTVQFQTPVEELQLTIDMAATYDGWQRSLGDKMAVGVPSYRWTRREAAEVVAAITPWNFPHAINLAKVGPALAAGCTVVLKPAPDTPWAGAALAAAAAATDLPPGVLNVVNSRSHELGAQLVADPRVDLISFTGSTATGSKIMASAAERLARVFLELGGKSAFVVLDDANVAEAASLAALMVSTHAGQGCALTTRLLVPRTLLGQVIDVAAATMNALGCGDPADPGTVCGPVISAAQRTRIEQYLALALAEGGSFACGGGRPTDRDRGFWIEPTLVTGLTNSARVAREEIFGPVLVVLPYESEAEAVAMANDSAYGLSGAVYSGDVERARRVACQLRTGTVAINGAVWYGADVPFGGYKMSGIGREMGREGFEEYLEVKSIAEPPGRP